ncbi:endoplasmic reticulum junction formation protein lunapark-B-like [Physella acuta]|uniref:endoplasmic reticulum junction formation protein lunapark-B-like n=1 Tax=Physella acuta TaxID=109671 RepID=UPI0027DBE0A3|nr:endoplasmic reticulum junction formation protein lunapark-B-like [Physella acuta]
MGALISRFKRQQTTIEVLEGIEKEITRLQRNRKENQDKRKKFVTRLLIYSIFVYVVVAILFFLLYFPDTWELRLLYSLPLLVFPFLIWGMKKLLNWYFVKRISSNDVALQGLRERKKQILEDVMETETYKKAREILEKFDPSRLRQLEGNAEANARPQTPTAGTVIHQRVASTTHQARGVPSMRQQMPSPRMVATQATPLNMQNQSAPGMRPRMSMSTPRAPMPMGGGYIAPPGPPMPRTVLPRERGTMDRLMDYLVGDGPENRYALVCHQCYSHNGMALKEEFEYLTFRCCYCYHVNPARKQRPLAPRLEFFAPLGAERRPEANEESEEEETSDEDTDPSQSAASQDAPVSPGRPDPQSSQSSQWCDVDSFTDATSPPASARGPPPNGKPVSADEALSTNQNHEIESVSSDTFATAAAEMYKKPPVPTGRKTNAAIKSATGFREIPDFDKHDFFSLPASNMKPRNLDCSSNAFEEKGDAETDVTPSTSEVTESTSQMTDSTADTTSQVETLPPDDQGSSVS